MLFRSRAVEVKESALGDAASPPRSRKGDPSPLDGSGEIPQAIPTKGSGPTSSPDATVPELPRGKRRPRPRRAPTHGSTRTGHPPESIHCHCYSHDDSSVSAQESLGILEVLGSGSGFIRRRDAGYIPSNDDIYVGGRVIQKFGLRTGDELEGEVGKRPKNGKSPPLVHLALDRKSTRLNSSH